jgi:adenosylcobinamide kinase / adenosylcobinamide-phosphate guanylyltransferase
MRELILGGQKSGKSRRAEDAARQWMAASRNHKSVFVATALACDDEMRERIARHRADRAVRLPHTVTIEESVNLAQALEFHSAADTLVVVDCLTLWLTHMLTPYTPPLPDSHTEQAAVLPPDEADDRASAQQGNVQIAMFVGALAKAEGPVVVVSNEIGLGVIPMGREVRAYVDALGKLNQEVAQVCDRVTLMAAGLPLGLKGL